eukprot:XP_001702231.1 predicted protein [Chlamydomonas reinhardtii]
MALLHSACTARPPGPSPLPVPLPGTGGGLATHTGGEGREALTVLPAHHERPTDAGAGDPHAWSSRGSDYAFMDVFIISIFKNATFSDMQLQPGSRVVFKAPGPWKLDQMASELAVKCKTSDGSVWDIKRPDGSSDLYLDAGMAVASIQAWANLRCRRFGLNVVSALPTLWISGLAKAGKSYTLHEVVPAVLAATLRQQAPGHPLQGMAVLRLNGLELLQRQAVADWATRAEVPVAEYTRSWVRQVLDSGPDAPGAQTRAGRAVVEMFESGFQAPVLVLLAAVPCVCRPKAHEVQALLRPTDARGELDASGAAFIRDGVLRPILLGSADHVLVAATGGGGMAAAWVALAAMPVNGTAPLMQIWPQLLLPDHGGGRAQRPMRDGVQQQQQLSEMTQQGTITASGAGGGGGADMLLEQRRRLLERSEGSPALFAMMLEQWWACASEPAVEAARVDVHVDVEAFVSEFMRTKMLEEVVKDWRLGLAGLTEAQRGEQQAGRYHLADARQRQALRAALDPHGSSQLLPPPRAN